MFTKNVGGVTTYSLDYRVWLGKSKTDIAGNPKMGRGGKPQRLKAIDPRLPCSDVLDLVDVIQMEANPVSDTMEGAPWAVMKPGHFAAYKPLFGPSTWVNGRKGITTDLNGVYFVDVIDSNVADCTVKVRTRPHEGKTEPEPAYFLCGLLHSEIVKEMIEAHNVSTNMGDIFKHVSLPRFDAKDTGHIKLAELVKQAHGQHDGAIRASIGH